MLSRDVGFASKSSRAEDFMQFDPSLFIMMRKLFSKVGNWFEKYLFFSKATLCIRGLVLAHSFAYHVVISILVVYLVNEIWKTPNFQIAAAIINVQLGVSNIMIVALAYFSYTYLGPFKVIVYTSALYLVGLVLLWVSVTVKTRGATPSMVFYGAAVLLAFGEAGRPAALRKFLDDKYLSEKNAEEDAKRVETRQSALWSLPWFLGAAAPLFFVNTSLTTQVVVSTILMVVSYLLFWCGLYTYPNNNPNEVNAKDPDGDHHSTTEQAQRGGICQVIESLSPDKQTGRWKFWLKPKERKLYYKEMLAMCFAFIVYSLVEATGYTFFFDQTTYMKDKIGNFKIPILYFSVLRSFSNFISSYLYRKLIGKKWKHATLIRIGCGLVCSLLCCAVAWQVELRRSHKIKSEVKEDNSIISMSVLWLIPQFSLLGIMSGLAAEGLVEFFADRVVEEDGKLMARYYGWHASDFVLGIGRLMTAVSILVFRHTWLDDSIYRNRLDKYYRGLTFLGLASLCYYLLVASYFYKKDKHSSSSATDQNDSEANIKAKDGETG